MKLKIEATLVDEDGRELPCVALLDMVEWQMTGMQLKGVVDGEGEVFATVRSEDGTFEPYRGWRKGMKELRAAQAEAVALVSPQATDVNQGAKEK